jgi:hypothetical protein
VSDSVRLVRTQAGRRGYHRSVPGRSISTGGIRDLATKDAVHETLDNTPCIIYSDGSRSEGDPLLIPGRDTGPLSAVNFRLLDPGPQSLRVNTELPADPGQLPVPLALPLPDLEHQSSPRVRAARPGTSSVPP